jgi:hypothetical protein
VNNYKLIRRFVLQSSLCTTIVFMGLSLATPHIAKATKDVINEKDVIKQETVVQAQGAKPSNSENDTLAKEASKDFSGGFSSVGSGFKKGAKVTGGVFKKAGLAMGHGFKKIGSAIRDFFVGKKDSQPEERDLKKAKQETPRTESASKYVPAGDLDAVGDDIKAKPQKHGKELVKDNTASDSAVN